MATQLTWGGFGWRLLAAAILVTATYNPEGYSYYDWAIRDLPDFSVLKAFAGIVLIIGWTIYLRATLRSLGPIGLGLAIAFFGTGLWLLVDMGWVPADSVRAVSYLVMIVVTAVLAVGISWSHVRRRLTGQVDADDVDE